MPTKRPNTPAKRAARSLLEDDVPEPAAPKTSRYSAGEESQVQSRKKVVVTTDGACIGNPGPGGWACVLRFESTVGEMFGCDPRTTNNRMELKAVIAALESLTEPCETELSTDSQYVQRGITEWLAKWKANGWRTSTKAPVANQDLWEELDLLCRKHKIRWQWVKGHATHRDNNRCDELANAAARQQISSGGMKMLPAR